MKNGGCSGSLRPPESITALTERRHWEEIPNQTAFGKTTDKNARIFETLKFLRNRPPRTSGPHSAPAPFPATKSLDSGRFRASIFESIVWKFRDSTPIGAGLHTMRCRRSRRGSGFGCAQALECEHRISGWTARAIPAIREIHARRRENPHP